ncbi:MAG: UDP-glucose/GDP-mannose dehydrogenase family protein, partial [Candidatus Aminicenantes bacterium]|nr:UDP-glucose/GDP-mannose dehydrogenase family protein [Candidatus Aminicenantes bacterium]
ALLGTAYRPNSEDTRNSPTLSLAAELVRRGAEVVLHDPYVRPEDQNLERTGLAGTFTRDLERALTGRDGIVVCAAHDFYRREWPKILRSFPGKPAVFDGCHLHGRAEEPGIPGLGKGRASPFPELIAFALESFRAVEHGVALEIEAFVEFINTAYPDAGNRLVFEDISRLAATCVTGCRLVPPAPVTSLPVFRGAALRLAEKSLDLSRPREKKAP